MLSVYGARLTTFEDSEKESEYGYVRKVSRPVVLQMAWLVLLCMSLSVLTTTISLVKSFDWKAILLQFKNMKNKEVL
ncbi:hypothetical protein K2173_021783 [Erythroxylum novogranatense]|uniref:Uncharacterized protein n=1 Tax=Erythroxylum novogranatense TaxID=1862640 RepID=A0AAV8TYU7_9ROSI|nr:hypothetical protein K2173_021783 [Erythroxylum novogranatense]